MAKKIYCPRCGNKNIIEYSNSFDCPKCILEFDKKDFESIEDKSAVLSIEEKLSFMKVYYNDSNNNDVIFKQDKD